MLEQLVERGIAIDGLTFGEARRRYEEVAAGAEAAYDVVGAEGRREMTLPDDLDDLVLATAMQGRSS